MRPRGRRGPIATPFAVLAVLAVAAGCTSSGDESSTRRPASSDAVTSSGATTPPVSGSSSDTSSAGPTTSGSSRPPARLGYRSGLAVPDPTATPGAALAGVTRAKVCSKDWTADHDNIALTVQNAVSTRYGVVAGEGTSLRLDQLVPASLGGDATARNVWPQPKSQSRRKNILEARLHQLVCAGELPLTTAQAAMKQDWTAAQRKYPPT